MTGLDDRWRTSSRSNDSALCVEVRRDHDGSIHVRDSKHRDQGHLSFTQEAWSAFTGSIRDGDFTV